MKFIIMFKMLIFSVLCTAVFAQADINSLPQLPLVTAWKKGEAFQYELIKGKINYLDGKVDKKSESHEVVTLSVLEVHPKDFLIQAEYNSAAFLLPEDLKKMRGIDKIVEKYNHFKVKYSISNTGEFLKLNNLSEIKQMLTDFFSLVGQANQGTFSKTVLTNMKQQMTSEAYITEGVFQELRLIHQFYGNDYAPNTDQRYDTELANMLNPNGKPIPAQATLKVNFKENKYCQIEHTLTPDAKIMKQLTFDYFNKMSGGTLKMENTEGVSIVVKDTGKYYFHLRSGWLMEMLKQRTTTYEDEKTLEYISMKLLDKGSF